MIEYNLAINGVYTNNLIYSETGKTGKCLGFVDREGERCLYIDPGVNDDIQIGEINPLNIMRCKIMHYTSFVGDSFKTQIELLHNNLNSDSFINNILVLSSIGFNSSNPFLTYNIPGSKLNMHESLSFSNNSIWVLNESPTNDV